MKTSHTLFAFLLATSFACASSRAKEAPVLPPSVARDLAGCNTVWHSPSPDSFGSMPLPGARGAGANVWVSEGSLWVYLAHNGAYDGYGRLLKLGCLRLTPVGVDWKEPTAFKQAQDLATGTITVTSTAKDGAQLFLRLRFLGESLVVDADSSREIAWEAAYGTWRDTPKNTKLDFFSGPEPVGADTVTVAGDALRFVQSNGDNKREAWLAQQQNVPPEAMLGLLPQRNFGGALAAKGGLSFAPAQAVSWQTWQGKAWAGKTVSAKTQTLAVTLGAAKNADPAKWEAQARALLVPGVRVEAEQAENARWTEFWDLSHIFVSPGKDAKDPGYQVSRNYQLFRQMLACNAGGEFPLKFNGFYGVDLRPADATHPLPPEWVANYGWPGPGTTPDYRLWGQMFMAQNQRWIGWPTLAAGDAELLAPSSAFYRLRAPIARARAQNIGAQGTVYVEPMGIDGTCICYATGQGLCGVAHLNYHFSMGLEHAWMTLQGHDMLGSPIDTDIPWMVDTVRFFDSFYRLQNKTRNNTELNADGKLVLYPTNGLELISGGTNTIETVAGLRRVTEGLLLLPVLSGADRAFLEKVQKTLPELPTLTRAGKTVLAPAVSWTGEHNPFELPELYTVFPYRLTGVTHPGTLALARDTWDTLPLRGDKRDQIYPKTIDRCWQPTIAYMAGLGWADEAQKRVVAKISDAHPSFRYPAFFATGDGMPDFNHAASGATGLQEMLLQGAAEPGGKIHVLPAWPKAWDVRFKLHTGGQTTVAGEVKDGRLVALAVTPESRRKDVVPGEGWGVPDGGR